MSIVRSLAKNPILRKIFLPIFKLINLGDLTLNHHHVNGTFMLHSFKHKGYWFHGARRESSLINVTKKYLQPDMTVVEVGGHIGYLTMLYADAVGKNGRVKVFEPGTENLKYVIQNCKAYDTVEVIRKAVSNETGFADFFEEDLTGQNNSLISGNAALESNINSSGVAVKVTKSLVKTITLTDYLNDEKIQPDFIKIDVEGGELLVLQGLVSYLSKRDNRKPMLMVEFDKDKANQCINLMKELGYLVFNVKGEPLDPNKISGILTNGFCLYETDVNKYHAQMFN